MTTTKETRSRLLNVRTGDYIKSVYGSASWRSRTGVSVEFTKNADEAATFSLGRATSLARGKVANRVNWKDIKVEEIVVDVVIEDVVRASDAELAKARVVFENILKEMKANFRKERTEYYNRLYTKLAATFPAGQLGYSAAHDIIE